MHPDQTLGKEFWQRIYQRAEEEFGTTDIPVDTFHKVWIVPERASVYEHEQTAYIVDAYLKVMLEDDYKMISSGESDAQSQLAKDIVREILLPEIEREVNEGKNFAALRQIYHALILAKWYKETMKESLLAQVYVNQNKVEGNYT